MQYKDKNGVIHENVLIKGESAFESAQIGGYKGTEEEFYQDLGKMATTDDIDATKTELEDKLSQQSKEIEEKTSELKEGLDNLANAKVVNLIDVEKCYPNHSWNGANNSDLADENQIVDADRYVLSNIIECKPNEVYTVSSLGYQVNFYGAYKDNSYASGYRYNINFKKTITSNTFEIPEYCYAFRFCITIPNTNDETWKYGFKLVKGNNIPKVLDKVSIKDDVDIPQVDKIAPIIRNKNTTTGRIDKACLVLMFDNTLSDSNSTDKMLKYCISKGLPFTVFTSGLDNQGIKRAKEIKSLGGDIQFYNGQPALTYEGTDNYSEQYEQFKNAYDNFAKIGIGKPKFCALSGGRRTEITDDIAKSFGFKWCRATGNGGVESPSDETYITTCLPYSQHTASSGVYCPIDDSDRHWKMIRPVLFHFVLSDTITDTSYNVEESTFKSMIDTWATQVANDEIHVLNLSQLWDMVGFPEIAEIGQHYLRYEPIDNVQHEYVYTTNGWRETTI